MNNRTLDDFDISDYAASSLRGWRVRWGAEGSDMVLLVDMKTDPSRSAWALSVIEPGSCAKIVYRDGVFVPVGPAGSVKTYFKIISQDELNEVPLLLRRCFEDHYQNVPAPRRKTDRDLLNPAQATSLENQFKEILEEKYLKDRIVYAVQESGWELANRLGFSRAREIKVNHYREDTFQADACIHVEMDVKPIRGTKILVIDDMVSSGRTAKAIIEKFRSLGNNDVVVATIYNIAASREVFDVEQNLVWLKTISNFYWIYGRGMDLITPETRHLTSVRGADKSFIERKEDVDALLDFFKQ